MTFDDKYLSGQINAEVFWEENSLPCFCCGNDTNWFSRMFSAPVCSEECLDSSFDDLGSIFEGMD